MLIQMDKALLADLSIPGFDLFQAYRSRNFCAGVHRCYNLHACRQKIFLSLSKGQMGLAVYYFDFKGFFAQTRILGEMSMQGKSYGKLKGNTKRGAICLLIFMFLYVGYFLRRHKGYQMLEALHKGAGKRQR